MLSGEDRIIPIAKMLEYRSQKLTHKEIGKLLGCSKENVTQRLGRYRDHIEGLEAYKERKADVLHLKASMLLHELSPSKIKEMSGYQLVGSYGILSDKARLEEGKSTSNVSLAVTATRLSEDIERLEKELTTLPDLDGGVGEGDEG